MRHVLQNQAKRRVVSALDPRFLPKGMNLNSTPTTSGRLAIEAEMARQVPNALATFDNGAAVASQIAQSLKVSKSLLMFGMGGSHAIGRALEPIYRSLGIDAFAVPMSEQLNTSIPLHNKTLLISSQSGESGEILRFLDSLPSKANVFGITLDASSTVGRSIPCVVGEGGPEVAYAATRSLTLTFAAHVAILAALGVDVAPTLAALKSQCSQDVSEAVQSFKGVSTIAATGRELIGMAEAAALGFSELSRLPAFAQESGQLRHGPMEMLDPHIGVIIFRSQEVGIELLEGLIHATRDAGATVIVFDASGAPPVSGVVTLRFPVSSGLTAVFHILPTMQNLMLSFAATRVADVGTPRRSKKITGEK